MTTKRCPKCRVEQPIDAFAKNKRTRDGLQVYCRTCHKAYRAQTDYAQRWYQRNAESNREKSRSYYWEHREQKIAYAKERRELHRERLLEQNRARSRRRKAAAFDAYGGPICACCGETVPIFLTIDHVDPTPKEVLKQHRGGSGLYAWLERTGYPPGFRVLCFNCNIGRALNGGECPHTEQSA